MIKYGRSLLAYLGGVVASMVTSGDVPTPKQRREMHRGAKAKIRIAKHASPLAQKIAQARRNAVAVGFRRYHRLSSKKPTPAIARAA